jgi:dephospho-CoA kinase
VPTAAVTGGIGCGKSTVTSMLASNGATVVDADVIARDVVAPGSATLERLVVAFGGGIVRDGALDRGALATLAFADEPSTRRLNEIVHPAIGVELVRQVGAARTAASVVVVAIPLYRPAHREQLGLDLVVVVDCPPDVALARAVARGLDREDVVRRMAAQPSREARLAVADVVVDNGGDEAALAGQVDALWQRLVP